MKAEIEAIKANAKGTKKGSPAQEALAEAQVRFKQAKQHLKDQKTDLRRTLKEREKNLKAPIEKAKKDFKDLQSSTKARLIADFRARWGDEGQQWVDAAVGLEESLELSFRRSSAQAGMTGAWSSRRTSAATSAPFSISAPAAREAAAERLRAVLLDTNKPSA